MTGPNRKPIYIINPNTSAFVTHRIDKAVDALRWTGGPQFTCVTLEGGPTGLQTQADSDAVVPHLLRFAAEHETDAAAFIIAAFGDPGLHALREQSARPILGIAESGIFTALTMGDRFGIVCLHAHSVPRHIRYVRMMGVEGRLAGDRPLGLNVGDLADEKRMIDRMTEVGRTLRDADGADVLVLGGAPMSPGRDHLEAALGIPVVDSNQAAASMAIGRVLLNQAARPNT